ncbi:bifunctional 5,10-methylenetetrahydrofolate dehydrogenase/5,10-methenyltetrahydrofolate cyclohydrolase [Fusibacter ferrireducens]|uniref:Bifunctional protein FolD n=1 Tax=Fusibacter ferrireducens TaxID=2785058 RepID=A0ABR9ZZ06_9FIRM|nr:bifunctional 5,10-methylenetetrahydrofolate dehydrogenase/5,10-methenyltetrahydrofolate cyclohydrolase [Fusibacter ferrireducens]MBF4695693.1 bifunctional 5,10-methylenetetrahydrofolate dehydrogenase/5,10-methenyltetrahydrofolate cyclohydrolase [Fusibacter ferrireducens]
MIIDGREIAKKIKSDVKESLSSCLRAPKVVAIILGDNPSSESYLKMLEKTCTNVGFDYELCRLSDTASEMELLALIDEKNKDDSINGILVQMPLPAHISQEKVLMHIDPVKDIDGFHPLNAGRLFKGEKAMRPCTPLAVVTILDALSIDLKGKNIVVIGRSNIVGKPLAIMLMQRHATVTVCHSRTQNIAQHTKAADIVILAVGKPGFLKKDMVTEETIVIDVGTNEVDGKLVGDADFDALKDYVKMITPVPGGVGPVTNAVLLLNVLEHFEL